MEIIAFPMRHLLHISQPLHSLKTGPPTSWCLFLLSFSSFPQLSLTLHLQSWPLHNQFFPLVKHNTTFSQLHYVMNNYNFRFYCGPNSQAQHLLYFSLPTPQQGYPNEAILHCAVAMLGISIVLYPPDTSLFPSTKGRQVKWRLFIPILIGLARVTAATTIDTSKAGFVNKIKS